MTCCAELAHSSTPFRTRRRSVVEVLDRDEAGDHKRDALLQAAPCRTSDGRVSQGCAIPSTSGFMRRPNMFRGHETCTQYEAACEQWGSALQMAARDVRSNSSSHLRDVLGEVLDVVGLDVRLERLTVGPLCRVAQHKSGVLPLSSTTESLRPCNVMRSTANARNASRCMPVTTDAAAAGSLAISCSAAILHLSAQHGG